MDIDRIHKAPLTMGTSEKQRKVIDALIESDVAVTGEHLKDFIPVFEIKTKDLYCRQINIKSGTVLLGAEHKTQHFLFLLEGVLGFIDDEGQTQFIEAPYYELGEVGTQRFAYALTDCVCVNIHATNATDIKNICEELCYMPDPNWRLEQ